MDLILKNLIYREDYIVLGLDFLPCKFTTKEQRRIFRKRFGVDFLFFTTFIFNTQFFYAIAAIHDKQIFYGVTRLISRGNIAA